MNGNRTRGVALAALAMVAIVSASAQAQMQGLGYSIPQSYGGYEAHSQQHMLQLRQMADAQQSAARMQQMAAHGQLPPVYAARQVSGYALDPALLQTHDATSMNAAVVEGGPVSGEFAGYGDAGYVGDYGGAPGYGGCGDGCQGGCGHGHRFGQGLHGDRMCGPWNRFGPYCDEGCCHPRWWDVYAEGMYMTREDVSRTVNFASAGGATVLSTDNLDFDYEPGFRVMGAYQVAPGANIEGGYFGTFYWASSAVATGPSNLLSPFSNFGINAPAFAAAEPADAVGITYSSELHSGEINYRTRFTSRNCRFHWSWLMGARYLRIDEDFLYNTLVDTAGTPDSLQYNINATNDLVGFQLGGDLYTCVWPGFMLGGECKAGVYANRAEQQTNAVAVVNNGMAGITTTNTAEFAANDDVAFVGECGLIGIYKFSSRLAFRGGYQLLYIDGVALAPENFNSSANLANVNNPLANRALIVNDNGSLFYHGFTAGLECTW